MEIDKNTLSLAGEFATLSQLALEGKVANLTLGHTKGVDILVADPEQNGKMYKLEVKSVRNKKTGQNKLFGKVLSWRMQKKNELLKDKDLFYCFVNIRDQEPTKVIDFYIVPSAVVADTLYRDHRKWLAADSTHKDTDIRAFLLRFDNPNNKPYFKKYHNNWDFKI